MFSARGPCISGSCAVSSADAVPLDSTDGATDALPLPFGLSATSWRLDASLSASTTARRRLRFVAGGAADPGTPHGAPVRAENVNFRELPSGGVSVAYAWSLSARAEKVLYVGLSTGGTEGGGEAWGGALVGGALAEGVPCGGGGR